MFDILYLKGVNSTRGQSFLKNPLSQRRKVMESQKVFHEVRTRLELCYYEVGKTVKDIKQSFEKVLEERYLELHQYMSSLLGLSTVLTLGSLIRGEGLVIKRMDSKYILNRRTDDWIKVKPGELI